jgi:hypothetical protein
MAMPFEAAALDEFPLPGSFNAIQQRLFVYFGKVLN